MTTRDLSVALNIHDEWTSLAAKTPRFALCLERFGNEAQQAARFEKFTKAQRGHCPL